jgi:serine/threonine protein kinase
MSAISTITNKCPQCGVRVEVSYDLIGTLCHCRECKTNFVAPATGVVAGAVIGDFWVQKKLGGSLRSDVFLAKQLSTNRRVSVKFLTPFLPLTLAQVQAYVRRQQDPRLVTHPNIVVYTSAGQWEQHLYLVSEYLAVENMKELLRRLGPLPEGKLLKTALQIAQSLDFAWRTFGLYHGTIKPANVMILGKAELKLPELGFYELLAAVNVRPHQNDTEDSAYFSPEQAHGAKLDFRTDIYSLGSTLYHLATGAKPLSPLQGEHLVAKTGDRLYPPAHEINPKLSEGFSEFLAGLIELNPADRPAAWADLIADIEEQRALRTTGPKGDTDSYQTVTSTHRFDSPRKNQHSARAEPASAGATAPTPPPGVEPAKAPPKEIAPIPKTRSRRARRADLIYHQPQSAIPETTSGAPPWVLPFLGVALLVIVLGVGAALIWGPDSRQPALPPTPGPTANKTAQDNDRPRQIAKAYDDALLYAQNHPEDLDGAIQRFTDVRNAGIVTPYQQAAQREISRVNKLKREGAAPKPPAP